MIENLIVAVIVLVAAVYTLRKYLPAALREKLVFHLRRRGTTDSKLAEWLDTSSSCGGGCDTCKSCETPADPATAPADATEHVIKIVRRPAK
ncbi:MAG: hypothetical protein JWP59_4551 [Massilia sp.]|jgi:hypothetical protein|nr:hypothetical protein [Massilia sp.]